MQYQTVSKTVDAFKWFENGDHPEDRVGEIATAPDGCTEYTILEGRKIRFFRDPTKPGTSECQKCFDEYDRHGWIDDHGRQGDDTVVCPGNWVVTNEDGRMRAMHEVEFLTQYQPVAAIDVAKKTSDYLMSEDRLRVEIVEALEFEIGLHGEPDVVTAIKVAARVAANYGLVAKTGSGKSTVLPDSDVDEEGNEEF